jgi:hypothetical protein
VTGHLIALLTVSALLVAACGQGGHPFASFEARCAKLPPAHFEIVAAPLAFDRDDTQPMATLTARSGSTLVAHRTIGLTTALFGQRTEIELHLLDDRRGARACGTPRARVELSMQPMTVFIARELAEASCQREVTLSHEMKHVAAFGDVLGDAAHDLERALPEAIGTALRRAPGPEELRQQLDAAVRDYLAEFMHEWKRALDERQAGVDSPEEYARVSTACARSAADLIPVASTTP